MGHSSGDHDTWERQATESPAAFAAFTAYRDLGPARSLTKVSRQLDKSRPLLARWSRTHAWVLRAQAFDREQDRAFLAEQRQARKDTARRHARLAQAVQAKALARLQALDARELSPDQLLRYVQVAADLERRALDVEPPATAGRDEDGPEADALTDEERATRMQQLRRELDHRLTRHDDDHEQG